MTNSNPYYSASDEEDEDGLSLDEPRDGSGQQVQSIQSIAAQAATAIAAMMAVQQLLASAASLAVAQQQQQLQLANTNQQQQQLQQQQPQHQHHHNHHQRQQQQQHHLEGAAGQLLPSSLLAPNGLVTSAIVEGLSNHQQQSLLASSGLVRSAIVEDLSNHQDQKPLLSGNSANIQSNSICNNHHNQLSRYSPYQYHPHNNHQQQQQQHQQHHNHHHHHHGSNSTNGTSRHSQNLLSGHHHHSSIQTQQQLLATKGYNPLAKVGSGQHTEILTPTHLRKAKLMFFYVRYPNSSTLKDSFQDVRFNKNNTAQLVKWFSNFREFYYIQMEKFARDAIADETIRTKEDIVVGQDHDLINQLNNHYNKNRHIELPDVFKAVVEETLRHFFEAIQQKRDQEQSWKKSIYKLIARLDEPVPEYFKSEEFSRQLE